MEKMEQSTRLVVDGTPTEFVAIQYTDRIFLAISQLGTLGTLISASRTRSAGPGGAAPTFQIRTLLGRRDDHALEAYTRLLAERIGGERPLLVALALKPGHDASRKELLARAIELCTAQ
jgi:proteasome assembly chaperone 3